MNNFNSVCKSGDSFEDLTFEHTHRHLKECWSCDGEGKVIVLNEIVECPNCEGKGGYYE
jgi:DnaJ-class molecular chaperone